MSTPFYDTITAIATPPGIGGIAVVRVSGPDAWRAAFSLTDFSDTHTVEPNRVNHLRIVDGREFVDDAVVTWFKGPKSYTGDDVVEISCHGGRYAANRVLQLLLTRGVRMARPGEFTERAFLNDKLDLAQAEAVAGLIHARTDRAGKAAARQLAGGLSEKVREMRQKLLDLLALLELELDFSEEDVEFQAREDRLKTIRDLVEKLNRLSSTFRSGRLVREGLRVALVGAPNAGKSTLLNRLAGEDRAIVSPEPGTTRDVVEARIELAGIEVILQDTAGIRQSEGAIESEGIFRTKKAIGQADIVLLLVDQADPHWPEEDTLKLLTHKQLVLVHNKIDLKPANGNAPKAPKLNPAASLDISALSGTGMDQLFELIISTVAGEDSGADEIVVAEVRHYDALKNATVSLDRAASQILEPTLMAADLRDAVNSLGEITGETVGEEILDRIFSKFCIGK